MNESEVNSPFPNRGKRSCSQETYNTHKTPNKDSIIYRETVLSMSPLSPPDDNKNLGA